MSSIPGVIQTLERLKKLHEDKNADYSPKGEPFYNFNKAQFLVGLFHSDRDKVFACMVGIKLARIAVLLNSGKAAIHESVLDSFDDLIVYATIWRSDIDSRK